MSLPVLILVVAFLAASVVTAQASNIISIQGKVVNQSTGTNLLPGSPICVQAGADTCDIRASIFDEQSGGNLLWSETHSNVELGDNAGIFNLALNQYCNSWESPASGGGCGGGSGVDWGTDPSVYIQIEFDDDGNGDFVGAEVFARSQFASVPFAYYAQNAIGVLDGFDTVYDSDTDKLLNVDDPLGLGFVSTVAGNIYFDLVSTGDFQILDAGNAFFTLSDSGGMFVELDGTDNPTIQFTNLGTSNSLLIEDEGSDTSPFVIDADGNVGIGTLLPGSKLEVVGDTRLMGNMVIGAGANDIVMDGNDAYITGSLEVDGLVDIGSNLQLNNNEAIGFRIENASSVSALPVCAANTQGRLYYDTDTDSGYLCKETSAGVYEWFNYTADEPTISYGEIYVNDSTNTEPISTTYAKMTSFSSAGDSSNMTIDSANSRIIIDQAGTYIIDHTNSFASGSNNRDFEFSIAVNGIIQPDLQAANTAASNGDIVSYAIIGLATLDVGDVVEVYARADSNTTINSIDANLRLVSASVGGTGGGVINLDIAYDSDGDKTLLVDSISGLEFISTTAGDIVFDLTSTGDFVIQDNNVAVLTVQDNGSIGIGTNLATQPVQVLSNAGVGDQGGVMLVETSVDRVGFRILSSDGVQSTLPLIKAEGDNSGDSAIVALITGDSFSRIEARANGELWWGSGAAAVDTNLYRPAADTLKTDDNFIVGSRLSIETNGTATDPALFFGTDTDTGVYHGADVLAFTSAGSEQVHITPSGLRFIGKTNDPATPAEGQIWYRSDISNFRVFAGGRVQTLATVSVAQAYQANSSTINTSGNSVISWDGTGAQRIIDSAYTHNPGANAGRINVTYPGLYKISYNVSWDNLTNASRNVTCQIEVNGTPIASGVGTSHAYSDNNADDLATNSAELLYNFTAGDYYTVVCTSTGSTTGGGGGNVDTVAGQSWTKIEFIR